MFSARDHVGAKEHQIHIADLKIDITTCSSTAKLLLVQKGISPIQGRSCKCVKDAA